MAFKIFRKITTDVYTQHWTLDDPDWNKYVQEDEVLQLRPHSLTETQILAEGAEEISEQQWSDYIDEVVNIPGSRPPSKPRP